MGRRWVLGVVAVLGVLAGCTPPGPPAELPPSPGDGGLRVMTWNLLGMQADDVVYSEHRGWAARVDQLQPHVLVVQEAQSDDVDALLKHTRTDYRRGSYRHWACDIKPEREGVAILVRGDVEVTGSGGTHLGRACVDPEVMRVLVWVDVDMDGRALRIYGTHLTAGGGAAQGSRDAQIREFGELVAQHDPDDERRWILAGDLNLAPGDPSYRLLTGTSTTAPVVPAPMVDTFAEVSPGAADPATCPSVPEGDEAAMAQLLADPEHVRRCGYTGGWPKDSNLLACDLLSLCVSWQEREHLSVRIRIDHVMRPDGGPVQVVRGFVPNRADTDWASPGAEWFRLSDHLPYVVDLELDASTSVS